ncbi:hypothetical protein H6804_00120 [Candidatus Nomurabacteria bacterium]|nr:hypothetical protein [Candidatus Nomurabacteria bacterium]
MIKRAEKYIQLIETRVIELDELRKLIKDTLNEYRNNPSYLNQVRLSGLIAHFERFELLKFAHVLEKEYEQSSEKLTIFIDKDWKAFEFDKIFKSVDFLNKLYTIQRKLQSGESRINTGETRKYIYDNAKLYHYLAPFEEIRVTKIEYASPGLIDFNGADKIIGKIASFIEKTITFEFVKKIVDNYDYFKYRRPLQIQNDQAELRQAIRKTETEVIEEETRKLKLQADLDEVKYQAQKRKLERQKEVFAEFLEISELIDKLDERRIAKKEILENQLIQTISSLHNLGFETEKIKLLKSNDNA